MLVFEKHLTFFLNSCQSRVGPVRWLKPYTDEVIVELGQKGVKSLMVVPVRYAFIMCTIPFELLCS